MVESWLIDIRKIQWETSEKKFYVSQDKVIDHFSLWIIMSGSDSSEMVAILL